MPLSPLKLQENPNFKYPFRNISLLYEALTHSYDDPWRLLDEGNVSYRKKSFYRLKTLGTSVLKLLLTEQALLENGPTAGPGKLSHTRETFLEEEVLTAIGRKLELKHFIETQKGFDWKGIEKQYPDVVKALVGAVYVDQSEYNVSTHTVNFLSVTVGVLHRMYKSTRLFTVGRTSSTLNLSACFPSTNFINVAWVLMMKGYAEQDAFSLPEMLFGMIGYEFENKMYLVEALTHGSAKNYECLKDVPDYQRMEFLGDAVYELITCEYLFWYYVNDDTGKRFNRQELEKFTSEPFQQVIAGYISMENYILKPSHVEVKRSHVFLESLIGGIYLDSWNPLHSTQEVLVNLAKECNLKLLNAGCAKFPYSLATSYTTKYRLTHPPPLPTSEEDDLEPSPEIEHSHKIVNVIKFVKNWQLFSVSEERHLILLRVALAKAEDKLEKQFLPLASANMVEYERMNLYGVAAREVLTLMGGPPSSQLRSLLKKIENVKNKDGIIADEAWQMAFEDTVIFECLPPWKPSEITIVPELGNADGEKILEAAIPECKLPPKPEANTPQSREDPAWVSLDEALTAVACLCKFLLEQSWRLGKWVVKKMIALILTVLKMMLFLFLLYFFINFASHWLGNCNDDIANIIAMDSLGRHQLPK